jgi:quercetin dioxygenase-like cupin family protein
MQKSHQSMQNLLSNRMPPQRLYFLHHISDGLELKKFKQSNSEMDIKKNGSQPPGKGPAEYFTGTVRIDPLFEAPDPARTRGASVTFEPGARSAWHTHPLGQTLIVTSGCGWVQSEGGPKTEIRPGDIVWCPPKEKHWHGATTTTAMTHIAIQEQLDGKVVDWMEKVSDEQYQG